MQVIDQSAERLVFRPLPPQPFETATLFLCLPWIGLGLLLFGSGLVSSTQGHGYWAIGYGTLCLISNGGILAHEFYRCQASQRAYSLDRERGEFRIWGWQPLNYGWQPMNYTVRQAWLQPTLRCLSLEKVQLKGPFKITTSEPITGRVGSAWQVLLTTADIHLQFQFGDSKQAQEVSNLLQSYLS